MPNSLDPYALTAPQRPRALGRIGQALNRSGGYGTIIGPGGHATPGPSLPNVPMSATAPAPQNNAAKLALHRRVAAGSLAQRKKHQQILDMWGRGKGSPLEGANFVGPQQYQQGQGYVPISNISRQRQNMSPVQTEAHDAFLARRAARKQQTRAMRTARAPYLAAGLRPDQVAFNGAEVDPVATMGSVNPKMAMLAQHLKMQQDDKLVAREQADRMFQLEQKKVEAELSRSSAEEKLRNKLAKFEKKKYKDSLDPANRLLQMAPELVANNPALQKAMTDKLSAALGVKAPTGLMLSSPIDPETGLADDDALRQMLDVVVNTEGKSKQDLLAAFADRGVGADRLNQYFTENNPGWVEMGLDKGRYLIPGGVGENDLRRKYKALDVLSDALGYPSR